jgi:hypothetical protein
MYEVNGTGQVAHLDRLPFLPLCRYSKALSTAHLESRALQDDGRTHPEILNSRHSRGHRLLNCHPNPRRRIERQVYFKLVYEFRIRL